MAWVPLNPATAPKPITPYFSQGAKVTNGQVVFVSGQVALNAEGKLVGGKDVRAQFRQAVANVEAVLQEAGATLEDVVKTTVFLTEQADFDKLIDIRTQFFGKTRPASSTIVVKGLARPEFLVEIEVEAVVSRGRE